MIYLLFFRKVVFSFLAIMPLYRRAKAPSLFYLQLVRRNYEKMRKGRNHVSHIVNASWISGRREGRHRIQQYRYVLQINKWWTQEIKGWSCYKQWRELFFRRVDYDLIWIDTRCMKVFWVYLLLRSFTNNKISINITIDFLERRTIMFWMNKLCV